MVEMLLGPVDYMSTVPPSGYSCKTCGASGVKLWRLRDEGSRRLKCAYCAARHQGRSISGLLADGTHPCEYGMTNFIGRMIPAIPTQNGDAFYGYSNRPVLAYLWWERLPVIPV